MANKTLQRTRKDRAAELRRYADHKMTGKLEQLRVLTLAVGCVVIVPSVFLSGCQSKMDRAGREAAVYRKQGDAHLDEDRYDAEERAASRPSPLIQPHVLAILPLKDKTTPEASRKGFGVGACATLAAKLRAVPGLCVADQRELALVLRKNKLDGKDFSKSLNIVEAGRVLGCSRAIGGYIAGTPQKMQLVIYILDVPSGVGVKEYKVEGSRTETLDMLFKLSVSIVESYKWRVVRKNNRWTVTPSPGKQGVIAISKKLRDLLKRRGHTSLKAFEAFSRGVSISQPKEQIEWFLKATAVDPNYTEALRRRGVAYLDKKEWEARKAADELTQAIQQCPNDAELFADRARAYGFLDNDYKLSNDYQKAIGLQPWNPRYYVMRAEYRSLFGTRSDAIEDYTSAIRLSPKCAEYYAGRAWEHWLDEDYDKTIEDYTQAIRLRPRVAEWHCQRGHSYASKEDNDKAMTDFNTAIKLDPRHVDAWIGRASTYLAKGDYGKAVADGTQAIRLDPKNPLLFMYRAFTYKEQGDDMRAKRDNETAKRLEEERSRRIIEELRGNTPENVDLELLRP